MISADQNQAHEEHEANIRRKIIAKVNNWKEHYSDMDDVSEDDIDNPETEDIVSDIEPTIRVISKRDANLLLSVRDTISSHLEREGEIKRCSKITIVKPSIINNTSIESYIKSALTNTNGLHINEIITKIEALGWKTKSIYHKYNKVHTALRKHYYMFEKVAPAVFKLRIAFFETEPLIPTIKSEHKPNNFLPPNKLTTLKNIIAAIVKKFQTDTVLYPSRVLTLVNRMGLRCSYSRIHAIMQDRKLFIRKGFQYQLRSESTIHSNAKIYSTKNKNSARRRSSRSKENSKTT